MRSKRYTIWEDFYGKKLLLVAMILSILTHGVIVYFTLPGTYDAFVHMFFADHYARFWFEPWDHRWYTGFPTISYPPLVHQLVALLSKLFPLKVAFTIFANVVMLILVVGVYRFTKTFFDRITSGIASILVVVLSSIVETLHVYGQMPTLMGLAFLLNALPFLYQYIVKKSSIYLLMAMCFLAVTISSHHVTAIFGMVFFIAPTLFMAAADGPARKEVKSKIGVFLLSVFKAAWKQKKQLILFGFLMIVMAVGLIFPYWFWSKTDPINQVSIPHGSRDNFFEKTSSGLIFYIIPLTLVLALLPAITYTITRQKRYIGWAVSFYLCLLLGSGGTTPLPKLILGENAFNILTLDRFGFWASIMAIPFMAKFLYSFFAGPVRKFWVENYGKKFHFILTAVTGFAYFLFTIFIFHLGSFRPLQPKEIDIQPIVNFLNRDEHMRWRFLTLGFGDQMAWLSSNTLAATVDGNYHSARRLPELTTRPVERLENAKFNDEAGLASLEDFLVKAQKYSLKYVFSNDRFYDPLLYYSGWNRTIRLENGIMVWEKGNIPTITPTSPKPLHQFFKYTWGIFPISSLVIASLFTLIYLKRFKEKNYYDSVPETDHSYSLSSVYISSVLPLLFFIGLLSFQINELLFLDEQKSPESAIENFYNHLDFQRFEKSFSFFKSSPTYTLDQYLLEKSVNDGGLLPSYAKLDSLSSRRLKGNTNEQQMEVQTIWKTSLGKIPQIDTLDLEKVNDSWYIIPKSKVPEIPTYQVRTHTFTLYKKQGKRVISSFPTVKDDRIKKPFMAFTQANLVICEDQLNMVGSVLNADDLPVSIALTLEVLTKDSVQHKFYPHQEVHFNLLPKASTYFKIGLDSLKASEILSLDLKMESDFSDKGLYHGGDLAFRYNEKEKELVFDLFNPLSLDINIPGALVAEFTDSGKIINVDLFTHTKALRSGLSDSFTSSYKLMNGQTTIVAGVESKLIINGSERSLFNIKSPSNKLEALSHSFITQTIYLQ